MLLKTQMIGSINPLGFVTSGHFRIDADLCLGAKLAMGEPQF
jgi:hypothetical protein